MNPLLAEGAPMSPDAQESLMISLAMNLAAEQLANGTASASTINHFLKIASSKERLEKEMIEKQKNLVDAKIEALQAAKRIEELYTNAMKAMREYRGLDEEVIQ